MKQGGNSPSTAAPEQKENREVVGCAVVKQEGDSLSTTAPEQKEDREVAVCAAV